MIGRALAIAAVAAACSSKAGPAATSSSAPAAAPIPAAEAHAFVVHLADTATLMPESQTLAMGVDCATAPSCGGACAAALHDYPSFPPGDREVHFLRGCDEAARAIMPAVSDRPDPPPMDVAARVEDFIRRRVASYAARIRPQLDAGDAAALDHALDLLRLR